MTAQLPNPFQFEPSAVASPTPAEQATASVGDAQVAVADHSVSRFRLDESRFYLDMISMPDPDVSLPLFLRKPSPAFMRTLIELGTVRPR